MIDGRALDFHLWGINNQNFIMRDEQTGSWWQQVSGEAIQGPLKGRRLTGVIHDELSFGIWKAERPGGRVLKPVPGKSDQYAPANWERRMKKTPTVTPKVPGDPLEPRTVVVGVTALFAWSRAEDVAMPENSSSTAEARPEATVTATLDVEAALSL